MYVYCDVKTKKVRNLSRENKVSGAVGADEEDWSTIRGLSFTGVAERVTDPGEADLAMTLSLAKYPQMVKLVPEDFVQPILFRIDPVAFSILDYRQGFGHNQIVMVPESEKARRRWKTRMPRSA
jgi:uncharacterized protein YhbP (UPF0306 family)